MLQIALYITDAKGTRVLLPQKVVDYREHQLNIVTTGTTAATVNLDFLENPYIASNKGKITSLQTVQNIN